MAPPRTAASELIVARVSELDLVRIDFLERLERKGHSARVRLALREYLDRRGVPSSAHPHEPSAKTMYPTRRAP